jgi:8-oxo-dGTP diphosphatase
MSMYPMPFCRVELCVFAIVNDALCVLLVRREEIPEHGKWALPGGVIRVNEDKDLEASAARVAHERLKSRMTALRQHITVGSRNRDSRGPHQGWALSVVYRAAIRSEFFTPEPGKRVTDISWMPVEAAESAKELAFDHGEIVQSAVAALRTEVEAMELPFGLLPDAFTLRELQQMCEAVLGRELDKSSFRRRLEERQLLEPLRGSVRGGRNRPAQIFKRRPSQGAR